MSMHLAVLAAALQASTVAAQFGGGGYNPPPPICPSFTCPAGQRAVGNADHKIWSYGCKDSGMSVLSGLNFDPKNPMAGMGQKNLDKCCLEKDICKQTCGMSSKACHESFQKCSQKICKGDQNCQLQAVMADIMSEPYDPDGADKKYDPEETKCRAYNAWQKEACTCVPDDDFKATTQSNLQRFYSKFNPEKLNKKGEVKDMAEVWKKWSGKEPDLFMALATKYKEKTVERREKPKPPPYKPPAGEDSPPDAEEPAAAAEAEQDAAPEDTEETTYQNRRKALEEKKKQAKDDEDYDLAEKVMGDLEELRLAEVQRLKEKKQKAVADEDYLAAKDIKARLAKLEL